MHSATTQLLISSLEEALLSMDRIVVSSLLGEVGEASPFFIAERLIAPALERIGDGWDRGDVSLAQVYMSGRICEELFARILPPDASPSQPGPKMAIAVLQDHHALGKRIVCSFVRSAGYAIEDYGQGLEVEELVGRVREDGVGVLLVSTLMLDAALRIEELKRRLDDVQLVVGGAPFLFDERLWREVGADAMGRSGGDAVRIVQRLSREVA